MHRWNRGRKIRKVAILAIYCAIFILLLLFAFMDDAHEKNMVYGSTGERFDSSVMVEWMGITYRYREMDVTNYLLIGVNDEPIADEDAQESGQAVLLVLLSADKRNQTITPIVVDVDTIVEIEEDDDPENSSGEKRVRIGQHQAVRGKDTTGSDSTVRTLSQLFYGVPIDHYIAVDMEGIALLNDAIGGVSITLKDDLTPELVQGTTVSLDGKQAKEFICGRVDATDEIDPLRVERQKIYLEHLRAKLYEYTGGKLSLLKDISKLDDYCATDLRSSELLSALHRYENYEWEKIIELPGEYHIGEDGEQEFWLSEPQTWKVLEDLWFEEENTDKMTEYDE